MEQTRNSKGNFLVIVALVAATGSAGLATINLLKLNAFTENESLNETISQQLARNPGLRSQLAQSSEMADATRKVLSDSIMQDQDLQAALMARTLESRELQTLIADQSEAALETFQSSDAFDQAIRSATESELAAADPVDELKRSLVRYERQLATLAKEVKDDQSAEAVNAMQGQLVTLERSIAGLSDQVACAVALRGNSPRTFLLKSNESTVLPGFDLVISLSRLKDELIETVSVSAQEGSLNQAHTQVIGNVHLGRPFDIAQGNTQYEGVFTFAQSRLFSKAFVGFEIRMTSVDGESCLPATPANLDPTEEGIEEQAEATIT